MRKFFPILLLAATAEQGNGKADQSDIVAQNETLRTQLAESNSAKTKLEGEKTTLATQLAEANGKVTKLEGEKATLAQQLTEANGKVTKLEGEKSALTTSLADSNTKLQAAEKRAEPIQKQLAAKLVEHGIRTTAVEVPKANDKGEKLTATERVKLAQGQ